jgi:hypothetical protein
MQKTRKPTTKQHFVGRLQKIIPGIDSKMIEKIWSSFSLCGLLDKNDPDPLLNLMEERIIFCDYDDYNSVFEAQMPLVPKLASSGLRGNQTRDDMEILVNCIQGGLGELAVKKFIETDYPEIKVTLDYSLDKRLQTYVVTDIEKVIYKEKEYVPDKKVSIKSSKFGSIWGDIHGKQQDHSDYYIITLVGTARSTCRDFIGRRTGLSPTKDGFEPIPIFIAGMLHEGGKSAPAKTVPTKDGGICLRSYQGKLTRDRTRALGYTVEGFEDEPQTSFAGIGKFSAIDHYVVTLDRLSNTNEAWDNLLWDILPNHVKNQIANQTTAVAV